MYSNGANSAGHLAICKVVLRYQICWHWKVIIYIYKEPEVLQTNTCLSNKTYVFFKTGITMHLVRTFKTVDLFKVPLCEGIFLRMDGMIKGLKKSQDVRT